MGIELLRNIRLSTKILLLLEIHSKHHTRLKPLAEKVGITIQGVSEYIKLMTKEGLIQVVGDGYRITPKGVQLLHDNIQQLKSFVDNAVEQLNLITTCVAIAMTPLKKGERVGLFMEKGLLRAYGGRKSPSMGVAIQDATPGEDVAIKNLEGIIDLEPGMITILEVPAHDKGGTRAVKLDRVKKMVEEIKCDRIGAMDIVSLVLLEKIGVTPDFDLQPVGVSIEGAQKGLNILVLGTEDSINNLITTIEQANLNAPKQIRYRVLRVVENL
ncbi:MAG: hypothetical protein DRO11_02680 [Methanobacteriota archaeon]|nr:MAG: hypothetical protein DRO11_02680 [Euryarchaeota archaeon]